MKSTVRIVFLNREYPSVTYWVGAFSSTCDFVLNLVYGRVLHPTQEHCTKPPRDMSLCKLISIVVVAQPHPHPRVSAASRYTVYRRPRMVEEGVPANAELV